MTSRNNKVGLKDFTPTGFNNFPQVCKLLADGDQLECKVNDNFQAQFKNIKASHRELQTKYYITELAVCKDSMTKAITTLTKDIESQNNEKFRLNSTKRLFDTQNTERRNADHNLQMVITGFKASVNVNKDHADSRVLIDTLKAHMNATKNTPLVG